MAMNGDVFGQVRAQGFDLRFLLAAIDGHTTLFPQEDALRPGRVVERATAPQDQIKLALLLGPRLQLFLVGLAYRLCHSYTALLRCWPPIYSPTPRTPLLSV